MKLRTAVVTSLAALAVTACTTTDPYTGETRPNYTGRGVLLGAAAGAALGYLTNTNDSEEGRTNALIGAGVGALAGGAIGNYMDRQETAMREALSDTGVGVRREGNDLRLIMPGDVTFATNSADIQGQFYGILSDVSTVLNRYPATYVDVVGHADSTGPADYNQTLSENRALSVANYLIAQGVLRDRFYVAGMGERSPIASNDTPSGRQQNRRVEILIRPHTTS
ncbi:OmpA family protein [Maricaulis sp.]|jgi:outer membrane protein OmpA-like peptidoglycan-associated protein|uniref:OmpA family protein n=1 Tax=Maricaulis sp. TaxID=1486257 RepID=UPI001AFFF15F|nr:OmpA family protein [Maricaulis sp.]MBO6766468.1 OmpA family protein [Maricaulis sp.]